MAKQIYIDENGNPIEVSGTINNASMLPISANDSTDTKTYIDTKTALPIRHFDVSWGATQSISRNDEKDMLIIGGREGIGFQVLVPRGTAESVTFSNINSCLTSISATTSAVSITIKNSGVGSKCFVTAIEI